jgi:DNA-binding XRE family transcriptional regulator
MSDLKLHIQHLSAGQMCIDVELSSDIRAALFAALNAAAESQNNQACENAASVSGVFDPAFDVPETAAGRNGVPARLKAIRLHRGYSRRQLSAQCGLSNSTVWNIEIKKRYPQTITMLKLARALKCSLTWLRTGNGDYRRETKGQAKP